MKTTQAEGTPVPAPETITLRDGARLTVRPIRPDDAPRLQAFHMRLSPESIYLRYLGPHPVLTQPEAERLTTLDYQTRMAFVAIREEGGENHIVGVARYNALGPERPDEAEAAIVIEDPYQGRGLGTVLMERLLAYSRTHGIRSIVAEISAGNDRMLRFMQRSGLPIERKLEGGMWEVRLRLN